MNVKNLFVAIAAVAASLVPTVLAGGGKDGANPAPTCRDAFKNVMIIVLENEDHSNALNDPYLGRELPAKGQLLTNMDAVWHPSQPNYIAMIAGSKNNVLLDNDAEVDAPNIADLLEKKGKTWRAYQQNYPGNCYTGSTYDNGLYVRKHNPFMSFNSIRNNPARCANIVPATYLDFDAQAQNLPNYMFYTPNMVNDGHDSSIGTYSAWLKGFLEPKLKDPVYANTLFVVTYDESESYIARNQVYTVLLGAGIKGKGFVDNTSYNHYSVLKAIEQNFQLGNMGEHDSESAVSTLALNWKTC